MEVDEEAIMVAAADDGMEEKTPPLVPPSRKRRKVDDEGVEPDDDYVDEDDVAEDDNDYVSDDMMGAPQRKHSSPIPAHASRQSDRAKKYMQSQMNGKQPKDEKAGKGRKRSRAKIEDDSDFEEEDDEELDDAFLDDEEDDDESSDDADANSAARILPQDMRDADTLKIEKLLAFDKRSKLEWEEHCKTFNTSRVQNGRRLEILKTVEKRKQKADENEGDEGETRYLVKWANNSYIHVSWEIRKNLIAYLRDLRTVSRQIRKLERSFTMMDVEELHDMQEVDRIVDAHSDSQDLIADQDEFLVKWKSQGYEDSTWEVFDDIKDKDEIREKIRLFRQRNAENVRLSRDKCGVKSSSYDSSLPFKNGRILRSYQVEAVKWLSFNYAAKRNSILADEMGLGKTCQTVAFCHRLRNQFGCNGPFLVVAPLATLPHWQREFEAWTDFNCITYHGNVDGRELIRRKEFHWNDGSKELKAPKGLPKFDALVTNYETALSDAMFLRKFKWELLIVDEAHRLKNRDSKLTVALRENYSYHATLLLTGTPIQNSLPELWTLLNFIAGKDFASLEEFKERFGVMQSAEEMDKFHEVVRPYMLRRIKSEVEPLPDREDTMIEVELTSMQKRFYRAIYEKNTHYLLAGVAKGARVSLNNVAMELRKCCCHPYLIEGVESKVLKDDPPKPGATHEDRQSHIFQKLVHASGKFILLDKLLPKLKQEGHRVLIFSQMTRMLDILEDYLLYRRYAYERIDGNVRGVDRQFAIDRFSSKSSQSFAFLLSTRGCGQGINLTAADTVIMYDGDWNPQNDVQALARCHRIGQTKKVKVYRLITRKSYEYEMFRRASLKLGLDHAVMSGITEEKGSESDAKAKRKSKLEQDKETERLLKYGAYALAGGNEDDTEAQQFVNADIDEILSKRATTMAASNEDNRLSKATFISGEDDKLDIDDPDFWTKVVGLEDTVEAAMDPGERRKRRGKAQNINYAADGIEFAAGVNDDLYMEEEEDEPEEVDLGKKSFEYPTTDEKGRRLWYKKHYHILFAAMQKFGYGRWNEIYADVQEKYKDAFKWEDVVSAVRGFLVYCALKYKKEVKPNLEVKEEKDGLAATSKTEAEQDQSNETDETAAAPTTNSPTVASRSLSCPPSPVDAAAAGVLLEKSADGDVNTEESGDIMNSRTRVSDFVLVNLTNLEVIDAIEARSKTMPCGSVFFDLLKDLRADKSWTIPDCLTTRRRTRTSTELSEMLEDYMSDDETITDKEVRGEIRRKNRGFTYSEETAVRVQTNAIKFIRMFDKHKKIQELIGEFVDFRNSKVKMEEFPEIPGSLPVNWWSKRDDLFLLIGLHKHGWDPRRSGDTFERIRNDDNLLFTKKPPPEAPRVSKRPKSPENNTTGTAKNDSASGDDDKSGANDKDKNDTGRKATSKTKEGGNDGNETEDEEVKEELRVVDDRENVEQAKEWPTNHKMGLRAKRVVDWFKAKERAKERKEKNAQGISGGTGSKRSKSGENKREWSKADMKVLYKAMLRYGAPSESDDEWGMPLEKYHEVSELRKKSAEEISKMVKLVIQDAIMIRFDPKLNIERTHVILGTANSAKKLLERVTTLRLLREEILGVPAEELLRILEENQRKLQAKKKTMMPTWWDAKCDLAMLRGASRHGIGNFHAVEAIRNDPEFPFNDVCDHTTGASHGRAKPKADAEKKETDEVAADASKQDADGDETMEESTAAKSKGKGNSGSNSSSSSSPVPGTPNDADTKMKAMPAVVPFLNRLRSVLDLIRRGVS